MEALRDLEHYVEVNSELLKRQNELLCQLKIEITVHNTALTRIIAKLDPMFSLSEDDPIRKKASDDIGRAVIDRLYAEARANAHYNPQLKP